MRFLLKTLFDGDIVIQAKTQIRCLSTQYREHKNLREPTAMFWSVPALHGMRVAAIPHGIHLEPIHNIGSIFIPPYSADNSNEAIS